MRHKSGHEQKIARRKIGEHAIALKLACAGNDHVNFIAGMRLLQVRFVRAVDFHGEAAVFENFEKELA